MLILPQPVGQVLVAAAMKAPSLLAVVLRGTSVFVLLDLLERTVKQVCNAWLLLNFEK
jgi:hypothetical protein